MDNWGNWNNVLADVDVEIAELVIRLQREDLATLSSGPENQLALICDTDNQAPAGTAPEQNWHDNVFEQAAPEPVERVACTA
ncbi:hypothetical protein LTR10_004487 [Elasticomyces elasticus]|nr:hypothetical protein LTR10_004487 [Elasticomyces elasticus]